MALHSLPEINSSSDEGYRKEMIGIKPWFSLESGTVCLCKMHFFSHPANSNLWKN